MELNTEYMGLRLRSPLVASASPISEKVENIKRLEDAGASAVVIYSLFEEQLKMESLALHHHTTYGTDSFAEALSYFPELKEYQVDSRGYLHLIEEAKKAVKIPVIASLNGGHPGSWAKFATQMANAGADAIELNIYNIPTDPDQSAEEIERSYLEIVQAVKSAVFVPVAVKLSPFFTNMAHMAKKLDHAGANALVLFNRFYQPDVDLEALEVRPNVLLSTPQALRLPLRWIAILYGKIGAHLAATSGVHTAEDVVKLLLVGANVTMMASALLKNGIDHLRVVEEGLVQWMKDNEYESVAQMRGALSQMRCADPSAYERAQYVRAVTHYTAPIR